MKQKLIKYLLGVYLSSQVGYYIFAPLYALFAHGLSLSPRTISFIWGGYSLMAALFILLFGKLENKMKKGKMVVTGYFIYGISDLLFLLVHTEKSLILVLLLGAFGSGITIPAYKTMFAKSETRGKESQEWSWLEAGNMFAAAIGAGIGGLIIGTFGFRGLFITMAVIQLMAAIVAYKILYNKA